MNATTLLSEDSVQPMNSRKAATRARICDVANELFFTQDFNSVTMEEIAKAAGIRRSTLYLHFRDKEAILDAIAKAFIAKLRRVIERLPGPEQRPRKSRIGLANMPILYQLSVPLQS